MYLISMRRFVLALLDLTTEDFDIDKESVKSSLISALKSLMTGKTPTTLHPQSSGRLGKND